MLTPVYWDFNKVQDQRRWNELRLNRFEDFHNIRKGIDIYDQCRKRKMASDG